MTLAADQQALQGAQDQLQATLQVDQSSLANAHQAYQDHQLAMF